MNNLLSKIKGMSLSAKILSTLGVVFVLAIIGGANNNSHPSSAPKTNTPQQAQQHSAPASVTTKIDIETQSIPFTSSTVNDSTLASGTTKVTTAGVNGSETLTYDVTYTNGVQTDKKLTSTSVTKPPVNQVTTVGTYVAPVSVAPSCPNGTYINSVGNTVCSPYASSSAPAGATARCVDGAYSFSQSHRGTCSSHGGVAVWL